MDSEKPKVEFSAQDGFVEIRYFNTPEDERYYSWRLPVSIVDSIIVWRQKIRKQKNAFPVQERTKVCQITMNSSRSVDIRSLDSMGRVDMIGWSLPTLAVDSLNEWRSGRKA